MTVLQNRRAPHSSEAGFTLIELLVATTLLVLLSVALASGIRYGARIWQASDAAASQNSQMLSTQSALQLMLERAYPKFTATTAWDGHVEFDGRENGFSFVTPDSAHPGVLLRVTVAGAKEGDEQVLESIAYPELESDVAPAKQVLLRKIDALEFAYYGRRSPNEAPGWHAQWRSRTVPPDLVRVRIQFVNGGARSWAEFVIGPQVVADIKCTFDVLTKKCLGR